MRLTDFLSIPADIDLQQKIAAVPDELTSKFYLLVGPSRRYPAPIRKAARSSLPEKHSLSNYTRNG
eukprot:jgi/Mesen1/1239/ME000129S00332